MEEQHIDNYGDDMKEYNFMMFEELGKSIGKFVRYSVDFDPKSRWSKENGY